MAPRNTLSKSLNKHRKVLITVLSVFIAILYSWYLYVRIKNRQNSLTSFWKWQWSWVGWSNSGQNKLSMEAVLECMQEDIEFMRTFFISWICLLVPREITSVLSAFVLIAVALFTCHFLPKSKSDKNSKQRGKRVEKEEKNPGKSAARDLLNSYLSSASVAIQAPWRYISSIAKKSTTKCEHRNEDQTCVCCDYQLVQHKYSFSRVTFYRILMLLIICAFIISIPWEYIRLFQNEVAKRMAVMEKGVPKECYPDKMTITESVRYWLLLQLSWQHDPCEKYHKALLVDPLWEITPLMVLSSVITRSLLHPIEIFFSAIGKSFRLFFSEIPVQWQPFMLIVMVIIFSLTIIMVCGYKISLPMLLKIEPKTPVLGRIRSLIVKDSCTDRVQKVPDLEKKQLKFTAE